VSKLEAAGIRATTDIGALNLPAVLVNLPTDRVNNLTCGVTVTWSIDCIAPAPGNWDRTAWSILETLVEAVEAVLPIERSRSQPFNRPGAAHMTSFPSYVCTFEEPI
jgi:hypothetical protein